MVYEGHPFLLEVTLHDQHPGGKNVKKVINLYHVTDIDPWIQGGTVISMASQYNRTIYAQDSYEHLVQVLGDRKLLIK